MKKTIMLGMVALSVLMFNSCAKDGETGPAGAAGANGNANVTSSTTITPSNWFIFYDDGINYDYTATMTWSGITQDIKDKGVVMVYAQPVGGVDWVALPYSYGDDTYSSTTFNFWFGVGSATVQVIGFDDTGSPDLSVYNGQISFRIVAIASSSRMANPDVDLTDYNQVKKAFNLKD